MRGVQYYPERPSVGTGFHSNQTWSTPEFQLIFVFSTLKCRVCWLEWKTCTHTLALSGHNWSNVFLFLIIISWFKWHQVKILNGILFTLFLPCIEYNTMLLSVMLPMHIICDSPPENLQLTRSACTIKIKVLAHVATFDKFAVTKTSSLCLPYPVRETWIRH